MRTRQRSKGERDLLGAKLPLVRGLRRAALPEGHCEHLSEELGAQAPLHGLADDAAVDGVEDDGR